MTLSSEGMYVNEAVLGKDKSELAMRAQARDKFGLLQISERPLGQASTKPG